jgi:hypothetical protein
MAATKSRSAAVKYEHRHGAHREVSADLGQLLVHGGQFDSGMTTASPTPPSGQIRPFGSPVAHGATAGTAVGLDPRQRALLTNSGFAGEP